MEDRRCMLKEETRALKFNLEIPEPPIGTQESVIGNELRHC